MGERENLIETVEDYLIVRMRKLKAQKYYWMRKKIEIQLVEPIMQLF